MSASLGRPVPAATVEALHWAMQEAQVEYPVADGSTLVLEGPLGTRGVYDLPLASLVETARRQVDRTLAPTECERFFGALSCPPLPETFPASLEAEPLTPAEPVDPAHPLAGTEVTILRSSYGSIQGLGPLRRDLRAFAEDTGVEVRFVDFPELNTSITVAEAEGRPPDITFANPGVVVDLARHGNLVDLGAFLDLDRLRSDQSPYLVSLGTIGRGRRMAVARRQPLRSVRGGERQEPDLVPEAGAPGGRLRRPHDMGGAAGAQQRPAIVGTHAMVRWAQVGQRPLDGPAPTGSRTSCSRGPAPRRTTG